MTKEEKEEKKKKSRFTAFLKNILRQGSLKWPARNESLKLARVDRGLYRCATCLETFKREKVQIDHIEPVVPIKISGEEQTWDEYIKRLFIPVEGFQILCITCHSAKTTVEDFQRAFYNQRSKEEKKNIK